MFRGRYFEKIHTRLSFSNHFIDTDWSVAFQYLGSRQGKKHNKKHLFIYTKD